MLPLKHQSGASAFHCKRRQRLPFVNLVCAEDSAQEFRGRPRWSGQSHDYRTLIRGSLATPLPQHPGLDFDVVPACPGGPFPLEMKLRAAQLGA